MAETTTSPKMSPDYSLYRERSAVDVLPETNKKHGINMSNFENANIQIVPSGGADPTVRVLFWSEEAGQFVQEHNDILMAGVGPNKAYDFTISVKGRIIFIAVAALGAGSVKIYVSGFGLFTTT